jgi:hypothetical protein
MTNLKSAMVGSTIAALASDEAEALKNRVRAQLSGDVGRPLTCGARANAIKGYRPQ